jgi:hypothetical protein
MNIAPLQTNVIGAQPTRAPEKIEGAAPDNDGDRDGSTANAAKPAASALQPGQGKAVDTQT